MKTIAFYLFTFVLSLQLHAQGNGWEWQNPLPQGNTLNDIQTFDGQNAIAVGSAGTILKTGKSYTTQPGTDYQTIQLIICLKTVKKISGFQQTTAFPE